MNTTFSKVSFLFVTLLALTLVSCEDSPTRIDYSDVPEPFSIDGITKNTTESGLVYYVIEEGICPSNDESLCTVSPRDNIRLYYTKRLKDDKDEILRSSYANGSLTPVSTNMNGSSIVTERGFREGLLGMKEGEKRVLVLPPDLAYGGNPNSRYAEDTLWIDVELDEIVF